MKKKTLMLLIAAVALLAMAGGLLGVLCQPPRVEGNTVTALRVLSDADGQIKDVTRVADQKRILRTLDRLEKTEVEDPHVKGAEGITVRMRYDSGIYVSAHLYAYEGTVYLALDGTHYRVEADALEKWTVLYEQLEYPAETVKGKSYYW